MAVTVPARRRQHDRTSSSGRIVRSTRHAAPKRPSARSSRSSTKPAMARRKASPARAVERRPATRRAPAPARRPQLRLVTRPRFAINAALVLVAVVVSLMLAAVVLHTRLAERQVEIDRVETAVVEARSRFDVLRQQRAELRAPARLAAAAVEQGMVPSPAADFLPVDPSTVAEVLAADGPVPEDQLGAIADAFEPLDQVRRVKAAAEDSARDHRPTAPGTSRPALTDAAIRPASPTSAESPNCPGLPA